MHQQRTDADGVGYARDAAYRVLKQRCAETAPLVPLVDRQTTQEDDGDRVRHVAANRAGGDIERDRRGRK